MGWDTTSWCAKNICEKRCSSFLPEVNDYKRLDTSLYFIITNFHKELNLKPQERPAKADSHVMNFLTLTLYTTFD